MICIDICTYLKCFPPLYIYTRIYIYVVTPLKMPERYIYNKERGWRARLNFLPKFKDNRLNRISILCKPVFVKHYFRGIYGVYTIFIDYHLPIVYI